MRSAHPPERLEIELQSLVGPALSRKGYRVVGHGVTGVTWRRESSGKFIVGVAVLGLLAIGGLTSGESGSIALGVLCAAGAALLVYLRRPASVTVALERVRGGTEIAVSGGPDVDTATEIIRVVVAAVSPTASLPERPDSPGSLWSPPRA